MVCEKPVAGRGEVSGVISETPGQGRFFHPTRPLAGPSTCHQPPLAWLPCLPTPTPASWCLWDPSSMCLTWALPQVSCVHKGLTPGVLWAMLTLELGHHQVGWRLCVA